MGQSSVKIQLENNLEPALQNVFKNYFINGLTQQKRK